MTNSRTYTAMVWTGVAAMGLALTACGAGETTTSYATGQARTEAFVAGTVTLTDASAVPQSRQVAMAADGTYSVLVAGLTPPYLLRAEWADASGTRRLSGVAEDNGNIDVNELTDVAHRSACSGEDHEHECRDSDSEGTKRASRRVTALLTQLQTVLAPLFERYGITSLRADRDAVRALLQDVSVVAHDGTVIVTNRATGGIIFQGRLRHLDRGTFYPDNMPAGPGTTSCTAFTYSAYGDCQPGNTQIRTVLTSTPAGCTGGSPVTAQACTYVPPVNACTAFTYSAYGDCQPDNSQTRTVLSSSPAGCTGGSPQTSQACTYVPPVNTCTAFTYSAYGSCQPDNSQTRTVLSSSPAGCTGGSPVTSQACTYVPPVTTCTAFTYSAYGACQSNSTQTRSVLSSSPAGCTGGSPVTMQACVYTPPLDGAALYTQYCSGCHGNSQKGASASSIQSAIDSNRGGMGSAALRALTPAQIAAISAAP